MSDRTEPKLQYCPSDIFEVTQLSAPVPPPDYSDYRVLGIRAVCELTSLSRAHVYRRIQDHGFPKPIQLGGTRVGWRERDVLAWLESRFAESRDEADA